MRLGLCGLVALVAMASLTARADAAPRWLSAVELGPAAAEQLPDVAMNQAGDAAAAWISGGRVNAAVRPAGAASFTSPEQLSVSLPAGQTATNLSVAVDGAGTATVVWQFPGATQIMIQAATHRPGANEFEATQDISSAGQQSRNPQVAADASGNTVVVWVRADTRVEAATRAAGVIPFAGPFPVSVVGSARNPALAMDPAGNAVVLWTDTDKRVWASMRRVAGGFAGGAFPASPSLVSAASGTAAGDVQVAMNAAGDATAVWQRTLNATQALVHSATSIGGAAFSTPEVLVSPPGENSNLDAPQVGLDQSGNAVATWQRINGPASYSVFSSVRIGFGGPFTTRADLPVAGPFMQEPQPQAVLGAAGHAIVAWRGHDGFNTRVQAATLAPGGPFTPATFISGEGFNARAPQLAIDADGDGVAVWVRNDVAQAIGYDAAGPQLRNFSGPATAEAESATAWSVSPLDVWSGAGSTVWSFGDGGTAGGASAVHAYAAAGTYTVTVTTTDTIGNSRSASKVINVTPKVVPPQPKDQDNDGSVEGFDCNDANAAIHPGALDKPGNKIDENCDGKDAPFPLLAGEITLTTQRVQGSRNLKLAVLSIRPVVASSTLRLSCTGGRVPCQRFKTVTRKIPRSAGVRTFSTLLPKRKLRPGAKFEVRVTKPDTVGRVLLLTIFKAKKATRRALCLPPAAKKPVLCAR
jgi:head-tail adaptor